ncbi:ComEC/Rec2 family competence protein, partial [Sphingobacterium siyangense]|uniref:ComEC/Rec2 family competence protein n=1 Tax=Sphingobacterium siyangense TaxID=459529 RepID=UPI0028A1BAE8
VRGVSMSSGGVNFNIISIDGGTAETYCEKDKKGKIIMGAFGDTVELIRDKDQRIDLLILTHVDNDHIEGLTTWFENDPQATDLIGTVLFNSGQLIFEYFRKPDILENHIILTPSYVTDTGIVEGVTFEKTIGDAGVWTRKIIKAEQVIKFYGVELKILSPDESGLEALLTKWEKKMPESVTSRPTDYKQSLLSHIENDLFVKDRSPHNGSSIAFVLTFKGKNMLFLADAHPEKIIAGLNYFGFTEKNKLECEFVKMAHHGSKFNTNVELLRLIESPVYVISSDGSGSALPHKQCLARLLNEKKTLSLYFNYDHLAEEIFSKADYVSFPNLEILPIDHEFIIHE